MIEQKGYSGIIWDMPLRREVVLWQNSLSRSLAIQERICLGSDLRQRLNHQTLWNRFSFIFRKPAPFIHECARSVEAATLSAQAFLKQRAVNVRVGGRYSLANWFDQHGNRREFACRTSRVSPFRMLVSVPVTGKLGDRVVSYFGEFGKLDGWIADTVEGGFLVDLETDKVQRKKLASKLTWLEKRQSDPSLVEARENGRIIPKNPHSTVIFADGTYRDCFIIDMSASGAAVSADVQPELGTPLAIGACVGRVVRHLGEGFAVKFVTIQNEDNLEKLMALPPRLLVPPDQRSLGQTELREVVSLNI
jgi:hypothetical protein